MEKVLPILIHLQGYFDFSTHILKKEGLSGISSLVIEFIKCKRHPVITVLQT